MKIANASIAAFALAISLTAGCASSPKHAEGGMKDSQFVDAAFDRNYKAQRMATKGAHFGWVAARSIYENPINRPVSHIGSLASYAL